MDSINVLPRGLKTYLISFVIMKIKKKKHFKPNDFVRKKVWTIHQKWLIYNCIGSQAIRGLANSNCKIEIVEVEARNKR